MPTGKPRLGMPKRTKAKVEGPGQARSSGGLVVSSGGRPRKPPAGDSPPAQLAETVTEDLEAQNINLQQSDVPAARKPGPSSEPRPAGEPRPAEALPAPIPEPPTSNRAHACARCAHMARRPSHCGFQCPGEDSSPRGHPGCPSVAEPHLGPQPAAVRSVGRAARRPVRLDGCGGGPLRGLRSGVHAAGRGRA